MTLLPHLRRRENPTLLSSRWPLWSKRREDSHFIRRSYDGKETDVMSGSQEGVPPLSIREKVNGPVLGWLVRPTKGVVWLLTISLGRMRNVGNDTKILLGPRWRWKSSSWKDEYIKGHGSIKTKRNLKKFYRQTTVIKKIKNQENTYIKKFKKIESTVETLKRYPL